MALFSGLFSSSTTATPSAATPFAGLFKAQAPTPTPAPSPIAAPVAPVAKLSPVGGSSTPPTAQPVLSPQTTPNAFKGSLGGGYGASNVKDTYSGKPLLTYENDQTKSSQLLSDRTAPPFDPTVPQKIDSSILQNGRMLESVSQAIKAQFPGSTADELDHIMPLELGGSNEKSNLRLEPPDNTSENYNPSTNPTATDPMENYLAKQVQSGSMSLVDAWKAMAAAKNITLPEDGGPIPSTKTIQPDKQLQQPSQPSVLSKVTGFFSNIFTGAKNAAENIASTTKNAAVAAKNGTSGFFENAQPDLEKGWQIAKDSILSYMAGVPVSTASTKNAFKINVTASQIADITSGANSKAALDLKNAGYSPDQIKQILSAPLPSGSGDLLSDLPKNIIQMATRSSLGFGESLLGYSSLQPGAIPASKLSPIAQIAIYGTSPVSPFASQTDISKARSAASSLLSLKTNAEEPEDLESLGKVGLSGIGLGAGVTAIDPGSFADDELEALAKETDPEKITTFLTGKGVEQDGARAIAPLIARATTSDQVKAILTIAAERGLIYGAKETPSLAEEYATQEGTHQAEAQVPKELPAPEETPTPEPPATGEPAAETPTPAATDRTPVVNLDDQALHEAAVKTVAGKGTGINGLDSDTQQLFRDWVNQAGPSNKSISGEIAAKPFESLRADGMGAVHDFQSGGRTGQLADVEQWGKDLLGKEQAAGIPVESKQNYLPQYWANSQSEIDKAAAKYAGENPGKSLSLRPGFSKESLFPDYATGEKYGLTPKYNNIPDMINARVQASEKALADRTFFEKAASRGLIVPESQAPKGWEPVPRLPKYTIKGSDGRTYTGLMSMPKPLADLVNNHLNPPEGTFNKALQSTANAASALKQIVLTSGIVPHTAINLHGFNELANTVPELFNHPSLFGNALKYMLYPKSAENFIQANLAGAKEAALDGLQLGGEEKTLSNLVPAFDPNGKFGKAGVLINKARQALYDAFAKPLFEKMIPALKLQMYAAEKDALVEDGMLAKKAGHLAATRSNTTFGGLNLAELGRDKNLQNFLKTFTLAPDFWEARYKYVGNAAKGLFNKGETASLYRNAALAIGAAYLAMTIANKAKTGKWMFQNPPGHSMDVLLGQDSQGKDIWFRPFGTTLDLLRLPMDLAQSILQEGDTSGISTDIRDRVSALFQPIVTLIFNTDAFGNKIFQPATPSDPITKQVAAFVATLPIVPTNIAGLSELANRSQSTAQSISQAAGAPLRFNSATPSSVNDLATLIYSERTTLETQIKKEYASGDTQDAINQMAQYNAALLEDTINSYVAQGHKVTDKQAFTNWLVSTDQKNGGIKDLLIKPPTTASVATAKAKQGKPLFNKIFPSTITP